MRTRFHFLPLLLVFLSGAVDTCLVVGQESEQAWGDVTGRFLYDGKPPALAFVDTNDREHFPRRVPDESLLVNEKNRGIANVVVYLWPKRGATIPTHPTYEKMATDKVTLTLRSGLYQPRVSLLRSSQFLVERNLDPVGHATMYQTFNSPPIGPLLPPKERATRRFQEELMPVIVQDAIYPWMKGYLLVRESPYMAKTDRDGRFVIPNVPVGTWTFRFWHERSGYLSFQLGQQKSDRGRLAVRVTTDGADLGDVKLAPAQMKPRPRALVPKGQ